MRHTILILHRSPSPESPQWNESQLICRARAATWGHKMQVAFRSENLERQGRKGGALRTKEGRSYINSLWLLAAGASDSLKLSLGPLASYIATAERRAETRQCVYFKSRALCPLVWTGARSRGRHITSRAGMACARRVAGRAAARARPARPLPLIILIRIAFRARGSTPPDSLARRHLRLRPRIYNIP